MINVLAPTGVLAAGALLSLDVTEVRHLHVRHAVSGERVRLLDGRGGVAVGVLSLARTEARVEVIEVAHVPAPVPLRLAVAAGDRERFAWLVEKAAEVGVTDLVPIETSRSANVAGRIRSEHTEKLSRRAAEAIKQCGAPWAPAIHRPVTLGQFLEQQVSGRRWMAEQGGAVPPGVLPAGEVVTVVVGPEGGWTDDEHNLIGESGFEPVSFGSHVMRFETAALAGAILVNAARARL